MSHRILKPSFTRQDKRGDFHELMNDGQWESLVYGTMKAGAVLGNHYHKKTDLFFFLLSGTVTVKTEHVQTGEKDSFTLNALEGVLFKPYESHKLTFETDGQFVFMKSDQYDPANPDTYVHPVD